MKLKETYEANDPDFPLPSLYWEVDNSVDMSCADDNILEKWRMMGWGPRNNWEELPDALA